MTIETSRFSSCACRPGRSLSVNRMPNRMPSKIARSTSPACGDRIRRLETSPIFFSFAPEGHVTLMSHSSDALPQDFEVITAVDYKLDKPAAPKRIEFTAWRGNDVFLQGMTSWKIIEYSDDSFTTMDPATEQQTRWTREQTHRYFLTFAARSGPLPHGGPAFACGP